MKLLSKINVFTKSRENLYALLLFLVIFSATLGFKLNSVSIILLSIFYLLDKQLLRKVKQGNKIIVLLFVCYFLIHLLGYFYSINKVTAIHEIEVKLSFFVLPLIIATEKLSVKKINKVFILFKYWLVTIATYLILHKIFIVGGPISTLSTHSLLFITNIHQTYYSLFYVFGLLFIIHQIKTNKINRAIGYIEMLFFLFFIVLLGARITVMYALVISIAFLIYQFFKFNGTKKLITFFGVLFFVLLIYKETNIVSKISRLSKIEWNINKNIYNHQVFTIEYNDKTSNSFELRLIKWYCAINIVKKNIFFGVGSGDCNEELVKQYHKIDFKKGMVYEYNAHNQYLEEFVKFGLFGGLFFCFFIGYLIFDSIKKKNTLLVCVILLVSSFLLVESVFVRQHGVLFFTFFIPILYNYKQNKLIS